MGGGWLGRSLGVLLHGHTGPREINEGVGPPAVTHTLGRVERPQPADRHEVFSSGFNTSQVDAEDVGNPGGFAPAATVAALLPVVEAAEQMSEHRCYDGGAAAPSDQTHGLTWHRHPSMVVGDCLEHGNKVGAVLDISEVCGAGGKREEVGRPCK